MIAFPQNPAVGDRHSEVNQTWEWDGQVWQLLSPTYLSEWDSTKTYNNGESFVWPGLTNPGASHIYDTIGGPTNPGDDPDTAPTKFAMILAATGRMRGYFVPTTVNGGTFAPGPVVDGDPADVYEDGDYLISLSDSDQLYDASTGMPTTGPTATGLRIFRGDRVVYDQFGIWRKLSPPDPTAWGIFDATQTGGGPRLPQPVIDASRWYQQGDHVLVGIGGRYNLATGLPDAAAEMLIVGQSLIYNGTIWQATRSIKQAMIGFFDPNQSGGGVDVPDPIIDGTLDYVAGEYAIAGSAGSYDFTTGQPSAVIGAREVHPSDHILYDGAVWTVLTAADSPARGFMDPTRAGGQPPAPFPVINGSANYAVDDYLFVQGAGSYNFISGTPGAGVALVQGDKLIYTGAVWVKVNVAAGLVKGQFDPTINNGGPSVDHPVTNGSIEYAARESVMATNAGWYNFGNGVAGVAPGAVWVRKGTQVVYSGTAWTLVMEDGTSDWGWFDPTVAGGGTALPPVTNSTTAYANNDSFRVLRDGNYDFVTGNPSPTGTALTAGDTLRRDIPNSRWEVYTAGGSGQQTISITQNAHGFAVGMPVTVTSAGVWARAQANAEANLKEGTVAAVTSANTFEVMTSGILRMPAHGLTRGATYVLSAATAGGYGTANPTQVNQFVQPHFTPVTPDEVMVHDGSLVRRL